jgi:hypothetical protein
MLEFLRGKASDRKLRLFLVGCCRGVWDLLTDERSRRAVEVVERHVDGQATKKELLAARGAAAAALRLVNDTLRQASQAGTTVNWATRAGHWAARVPLRATAPSENLLLFSIILERALVMDLGPECPVGNDRVLGEFPATESKRHADLLRDIFGPLLYRPVTVDPSWLGWNGGTVVQLARSIYEDRRFGDLPVLADALEESGCTDSDILGHCRSGGEHVRGCWVVDLVLGKG